MTQSYVSSTNSTNNTRTALSSEHYGLCRICLDEVHRSRLISPCQCRGSHAYVHKSCLKRWCDSSRNAFCEICNKEYKIKSMGMKRWTEWTAPQPLGNSFDDKVDYYVTFVWLLLMIRMGLLIYFNNYDTIMTEITAVVGRGVFRAVYFVTLLFNTWYYTFVGQTIIVNWWHNQQKYEWEFSNL